MEVDILKWWKEWIKKQMTKPAKPKKIHPLKQKVSMKQNTGETRRFLKEICRLPSPLE